MSKKDNKDRRKLKMEPRLNVQLTEEQKQIGELLYEHDIVFIEGKWGTGKTLAAVAHAIKMFRKKEFSRIYLSRPFIPDKGLGALPGTVDEKLTFETQPLLDNVNTCQAKSTTETMLSKGELLIQYLGKIKGSTVTNGIMIIDEATDLTYQEFVDVLTRLGKDSKMVFIVSKEQIHKTIGKNSCYYRINKLKNSDLVGWIELTSNHRNDSILKIIDFLDKKESENLDN